MSTERVALAAELAGKVDKVTGKGLSTNDFTTAEKTKLDGLEPYTIPYGALDATSTATVMTVTVDPPITKLEDGVCIFVKNGVVTSAADFTLNVNGLGAKPVYNSMAAATRESTLFNVAYTFMFVYDSTRVAGGCWVLYRGYDSNTNTIAYQVRSNYLAMTASQKGYRYRIWFTSADGKHWVPANTSSSTNNTSKRTPNTTAIDPFGRIVYNSTNGTVSAGDSLPTATVWSQYIFSLGYSFNDTGAALTLTYPCPVWIKCQPQTNGSALLKGCVQSLPATADGFIYIYLGNAYSATSVEMFTEHPVYYHDGTGIRAWTGATPPAPATAAPAMDGTAAVGTSALYARSDHVHPSDTSRQAKITASGLLKGNGSGTISAAVAGTDYQAPLSAYTSTPSAPTASGSAGSSTAYAKGDHAHPAEMFVVTAGYDIDTGEMSNVSARTSEMLSAFNAGKLVVMRVTLYDTSVSSEERGEASLTMTMDDYTASYDVVFSGTAMTHTLGKDSVPRLWGMSVRGDNPGGAGSDSYSAEILPLDSTLVVTCDIDLSEETVANLSHTFSEIVNAKASRKNVVLWATARTGADSGGVMFAPITDVFGSYSSDFVPGQVWFSGFIYDGGALGAEGAIYCAVEVSPNGSSFYMVRLARQSDLYDLEQTKQASITASGILKGNGSGTVTAAIAGTDYQTPLSAYASNPAMDGTASAGSSTAYAKGDHVHPTDTSRQAKITAYGMLKGAGGGSVSAAMPGVDYASPDSVYYKLEGGGSGSDSSADGFSSADVLYLKDRTVNSYYCASDMSLLTLVMPSHAGSMEGVFARDFILDIDNSHTMTDLGLEIQGLGDSLALRIPSNVELADITMIAAGTTARLYFSEAAPEFGIPVFTMHRLDLSTIMQDGGSSDSDSPGYIGLDEEVPV